jgi:hypothetical protein
VCPRIGASIPRQGRYDAVDKDFRKTVVRMSKRARKRAPPKDERDYFYICEECGQAVDKRSTAQIFHHEELSHLPLTEAELTELCLTERAWSKSRRCRPKPQARS